MTGMRSSTFLSRLACLAPLALLLLSAPTRAALPAPPPEETPVTIEVPDAGVTNPPPRRPAPALPPLDESDAIIPPLSIYDSGLLLARAMQALDRQVSAARATAAAEPGKSNDPNAIQYASRIPFADRALQMVIAYVDQVDRAHPTLPNYTWASVSAEKVPNGGWTTQVFPLPKPLKRVTALALRVHHGDVEIKYLAAVDANNTKWEFNEPIAIQGDQPRPEICYLSLPTHLKEVRVVCRRADVDPANRARLFIEAGVSSVPESARQSIYWLQVARGDLKNRRLEQAIGHIRQAYLLLKDYQASRKL